MSLLYTNGKRGEDQAGEHDEGCRVKVRTTDLHERWCGDGGVASLAGHAQVAAIWLRYCCHKILNVIPFGYEVCYLRIFRKSCGLLVVSRSLFV